MLYNNLSINSHGHLTVGGLDTVDLAREYGTPLFVVDEDRLRENIRTYKEAMAEHFGPGSEPLYASKSLCFKEIYRIVHDEGISSDVVSPGELFTALAAGLPAGKLYFHGNSKTDEDIKYALAEGVGCFIVDNPTELDLLDRYAGERGVKQAVLLRITPGIDNHTLKAINTGRIDNQFGVPIETGQAEAFVSSALSKPNLHISGFHSHIGSQIFDSRPFCDAVDTILSFAKDIRDRYGFVAETFNLGGGFAVRYVENDPVVDIRGNIAEIADHLRAGCEAYNYPMPRVLMEPGRSIVADAGLTLYTVGVLKEIAGYRTYVTVDGGMADNPRYALYGSAYTAVLANRMDDADDGTYTIAGRACESGDLIQEHVPLPQPERHDLIAVLTTGAYNFSMASNYNRLPRPAVVMVSGGTDRLVVRRQTFEDMLALDI